MKEKIEDIINSLSPNAIKRLAIVAVEELVETDTARVMGSSIYWEVNGEGLIDELDMKDSDWE